MVYIPIDIDDYIRKECKRRRYSDKTAKTYIFSVHKFLKFCKDKELGKISKMDVRKFLEDLSEKNRSGSTMNTYYMAIRFLFENVLEKRMWIDIKYSKVPKKLPVVLTKEEVKKLFDVIKNSKHKLMLELMYGAGLRVSELINLKVKDLQSDKSYGFVRKGKGNKDRLFIIPEKLKEEIFEIITKEKLKDNNFLFINTRKTKYSAESIRKIMKDTGKKAGIKKEIHPHTLRHSFATHLIENGYDVASVQSMLGHKSPETTFVYLHMDSAKMIGISSPFDSLN